MKASTFSGPQKALIVKLGERHSISYGPACHVPGHLVGQLRQRLNFFPGQQNQANQRCPFRTREAKFILGVEAVSNN